MAGSSMNLSVTISTDAKRAVEGFAALKRSLAEQNASLKAAREEAARLAAQLKATGGTDPQLARAFEEAKKRAADLKTEVAQGRERLELMRRSLAAGGIDTRNLSESMRQTAQQTRAAAEQAQALARMARETQRVNQARDLLGISRDTTERDIRQVQAALQRLKDSGRLSGEEMAHAMLATKTRMAELRMEAGGLMQSLGRIKEQAAVAFAPLAGLGFMAAGGAKDFLAFGRKLSEIRTLTGASREEMDAFGRSIRQMAQTMGKDANDLAAAAYNIISSGVPQARALEVLALSSKAATAGVANVNDTARLGLAVMNSYGGTVDDLASIYDTLFMTVKNGVTTIPELAAALGRQQLKSLDRLNALVEKNVKTMNRHLTELEGVSEPLCRPDQQRVYYHRNLLFVDFKALGFSREALIRALKAEGVDVNFWDYPEQHKLKIYSEAKWWHHPPVIPASMPGNAYVNANHIFLPLFYEEAPDVIEQYVKAFQKVWSHRKELAQA